MPFPTTTYTTSTAAISDMMNKATENGLSASVGQGTANATYTAGRVLITLFGA